MNDICDLPVEEMYVRFATPYTDRIIEAYISDELQLINEQPSYERPILENGWDQCRFEFEISLINNYNLWSEFEYQQSEEVFELENPLEVKRLNEETAIL